MKPRLLLLTGLLLAGFTARAQWVLQPFTFANSIAPYSPCVAAFSIADAQSVWAVALNQQPVNGTFRNYGDNEVAHTTDGGATWTVRTVPGVDFYNEIFNNVVALSATTALLCTKGDNNSHGRILRTVDGGTTWTTQTTSGQFTDPASYANFFFFFTPTEGICVGDPIAGTGNRYEVYRTTDGGTTWTPLPLAALPVALSGEEASISCSAQVGSNAWFSTSQGRVFRSADRGQTWAVSDTGLGTQGAISFRDAANGLVATPGLLARTTDGGATWQKITYAGPLHRLVAAVPGTGYYLSAGQGPDAGSSISRDNGTTWTALETTHSHFSLAVLNATTAWTGAVDYQLASRAGLGAYRLASTVLGARPAAAGPSLAVFPNPSPDGRLTVTLPPNLPAGAQLRVVDAMGRLRRARSYA